MTGEKRMLDCEARAKEAFRDHTVQAHKLYAENSLELLVWGRPKSSFYRINYIRHHGTLMIHGDCYEATYQWSDPHTLRWMGDLDFGYFFSKCRASSHGRDGRVWEPAIAIERMKERIKDGDFGEIVNLDLDDLDAACESPDGVYAWLCDNKVADAWEAADIGYTFDVMAYYHWRGLQMAVALLPKESELAMEEVK